MKFYRLYYRIDVPKEKVYYSKIFNPLLGFSNNFKTKATEITAYFEETTRKITETREWTKNELKRLGFKFPNSETNFIFATHQTVRAEIIFNKLREKHIFVRHFNVPRIDNYLRISIGTQEEMKYFITELEKIIVTI